MFKLRSINNKSCNIMRNFYNFRNTMSVTDKRPILYGDEISPPVRFVLMTAAILKIDIDFRKIDLFKTENKSDFFKKINPLQKVPVLIAQNTNICDSHAISIYLCQLAKDQSLYPEDPVQRAKINQILFFNSSTLFPVDRDIMTKYFAGDWPLDNLKLEEWYTALDYLEYNLADNEWLTGNKMKLCDVCAVTVVTSMLLLFPLTERHRKVQKWVKNFENLTFYDINKQGISDLTSYVKPNQVKM